jgi:hypothetical protein
MPRNGDDRAVRAAVVTTARMSSPALGRAWIEAGVLNAIHVEERNVKKSLEARIIVDSFCVLYPSCFVG